MTRYLNGTQAMARLGISYYKLQKLVAGKQLTPPIRLVADMTARWYVAEEVDALAQQLTTERAQATMQVHVGRRGSPVRAR